MEKKTQKYKFGLFKGKEGYTLDPKAKDVFSCKIELNEKLGSREVLLLVRDFVFAVNELNNYFDQLK